MDAHNVDHLPDLPDLPDPDDDRDEVRAAAFRVLLRTGQASFSAVARAAGRSEERTAAGAGQLAEAGLMVLDGDQVLGVAGLSRVTSQHRLQLGSATWHTWCAYDLIGIPAALGSDALVETRCPACRSQIRVTITGGRPPIESPLLGWLPSTTGADPLNQFCPLANLFCSRAHLEQWRQTQGDPAGQAASLEDLADRGTAHWGPIL